MLKTRDNKERVIHIHKIYSFPCKKAQNQPPVSFLPEFLVLSGNSGRRAHLSRCHAKLSLPFCPQTHNVICRRKEQTELEQVLPESAIPCLTRMEHPLHDQKGMLHADQRMCLDNVVHVGGVVALIVWT